VLTAISHSRESPLDKASDPQPVQRIELHPRTLLAIVVTLAVCWLLIRLLPVLLIVVVALFVVGTLNPAVEWLERHRLSRIWAVVVVFAGSFLVVALLAALTLPSLFEQARDVIEHEAEIRERVAELLDKSRVTAKLSQPLRQLHYDELIKASAGPALIASTRVVEFVAYLASTIFVALYTMIDRDRLRGGLFAVVPRRHHVRLSRVLIQLETIVGGYIRGQALTSLLITIFALAMFTACQVPNALALAVFAGVVDVLPYVGGVLTIVPAAAAAAGQGVVTVLVIVISMLAYQEFESRFVVPRVYGRILRLPSSVVLVSLLTGGILMGILGALLVLPIAAAIRMLIEELRLELPGERADDAGLRKRDRAAEREYAARSKGMPAEQSAAIAVEISEERYRDDKNAV